MPKIERIIKKEDKEFKELIADVPDKSGRYSTAYGEMEITLGPTIQKKGQVALRKIIIKEGFLGEQRRVMKLHPSPKVETLLPLSKFEFLSIKSQPVKTKKGRERFL